MAVTKYIVDNLSGQTISGDLTINNLTVLGLTNKTRTYKALLTQTGSFTGTDISAFLNNLIVGETYEIITYSAGDDFSNIIGEIISGTTNQTGCVFIASGTTPTNWNNGSLLSSQGELFVNVLENSLGFDLEWSAPPYLNNGSYVGINTSAQEDNTIPVTKTVVTGSNNYALGPLSPVYPTFYTSIGYVTNTMWLNDTIQIDFWYNNVPPTPPDIASNSAYYSPITITICD